MWTYYTAPELTENAVLNVSFAKDVPTTASAAAVNRIKVRGHQGTLRVSGVSAGGCICVYDLDGQLVSTANDPGGDWPVELPRNRVYVVKPRAQR